MIWGYLAAFGSGCLEFTHSILKSEGYQCSLEHNVGPKAGSLLDVMSLPIGQ